jgi:UvrD-like helicase C-terminal domain
VKESQPGISVSRYSERYKLNQGGDLMRSDEEELDVILTEVGEEILVALAKIAQAAQTGLSSSSTVSTGVLANPSNTMVRPGRAEQHLNAINFAVRENLRRLLDEPFVARVEVDWNKGDEELETYYFSRPSAPGLVPNLVTSRAPLGRLAEHEAGETVVVNGRKGRIVKRSVINPIRHDRLWDARVRRFESMPWGDVLEALRHESIRQVLEAIRRGRGGPLADEDILGQLQQEALAADSERHRIRRRVVDRIALRDQPILDKFQGEIFRLPLDRQLMLFGPPGSGKTTTLIKRLAQKRTPYALTEDEEARVSGYLHDNLLRPGSWAMFSPTELLKEYLGEAFNQEGVPDADNVRTWEKERHDLARNVLGILRSASSGRFQLETSGCLLVDPSSRGIANLHDDFSAYAETNLLKRFNDALDDLLESEDDVVRREVSKLRRTLDDGMHIGLRDVFRLFDQAEGLQSEIKRIGDQSSEDLKRIVNKLLNAHRTLLDEVVAALPIIRAQEGEEVEDDTDETAETTPAPTNARFEASNLIMNAMRTWARAVAEGRRTIGGQAGRVIELIGDRLPPESQLVDLGVSIATRSQLRALVQAPRTFVLGVPALYARFRRQSMRDGNHFASSEATTNFFARKRITPDEVDVVTLVMLRNARWLLQYPAGKRLESATQHDWLENIKGRYLMQVFVDEATDLSAVQLACTIELADPRLRSWFASGDLRQRITSNGIQNRAEIEWLNRVTGVLIDIREIEIGYRQSQRLRDLANALAALDGDGPVVTKQPRESEEADVWPIVGEHLSQDNVGAWLAQRIFEVETAIGRLPSIAVFVDGDDLIDPLVSAAQHTLEQRNIRIVGCKEGRVVGDTSEVRVFDIQHIKGLEFEAVFFLGIDGLAQRIPGLFQRFFYVGATRAATYLAITCEGTLPVRLEAVRPHFSTGSWA